MKRLIICLAVLLTVLPVVAQNEVAGVRYESTEITHNNEVYSIFTYIDDDGTYGYYLSVAHEMEILTVTTPRTESSFSIFDEACIWLGADREAAFATLDSILALFDTDAGTIVEMNARTTTGGERLGKDITVICEVTKKMLGGKRLWFYFTSGKREGESYINKSTVKQLRWGLNVDKKLHSKKK